MKFWYVKIALYRQPQKLTLNKFFYFTLFAIGNGSGPGFDWQGWLKVWSFSTFFDHRNFTKTVGILQNILTSRLEIIS